LHLKDLLVSAFGVAVLVLLSPIIIPWAVYGHVLLVKERRQTWRING
jgi:hypothetical protein